MKTTGLIAALLALLAGTQCLWGQETVIDSFHANGEITWHCPSNAYSTVEWASSLSPTSTWSRSWVSLIGISAPTGRAVAKVPMFYRVSSYVNGLFIRMPLNRTYTYAGSNAVGGTWTSRITCVGGASIAATSNNYMVVSTTDVYSGLPPAGTDPDSLLLWRSTDTKAYTLDESAHDQLQWQYAAAGTTWTNASGTNLIEAIESITVPAGTFTNCVRIMQGDGSRVWISPGLFMVKSEFLLGNPDGPGTQMLQSWTDH